ncbi:MGDG synthase family glycosyltransferase [Alkaliphilus hydrothermalis]|uniref:Processive 1,2-diacylglycerol beta-glucosyltransferase n=1 Tax=Alkaliphilus hydrothermalis TaxID=1482730 RepID=A0ABS2NUG3_9FIRM|nr:glycosyltransferase [Alkaliphilus hydrothermalis]MBM7616224.1 processive 1,2-diacylglycerol beta-glucosyltransferase [Alkaliphilus hydrothermalis]
MNIAIVTASIGHGHNSVALALEEKVKSEGRHNVAVFDILEDSRVSQILKSVYLEMITKTPYLYSKMYQWSQRHRKVSSLTSYFNFICLKNLKNIISDFKPDVFIFTHPFPALSYRQSLKIPAWTVITDYSYHPIWYSSQINGYFVANTDIKDYLTQSGFPQDFIYETGIPIKDSFFKPEITEFPNKTVKNTPLILIMGGGLGLGALSEIVEKLESLDSPFESIVLTGKNQELYNQLNATFKNKRSNRWKAMSFTNDVPNLMRQADLLISKGGAITLTEAMASKLPTVIYKPITGHEEENTRFVCNQEWAKWAETPNDLLQITQRLLTTPEELATMKLKAAESCIPSSTEDILETIVNDYQKPLRRISL